MCVRFTCAIRPRNPMGYHGVGALRIDVLCQKSFPIFIRKEVFCQDISRKNLLYLANSTIPILVHWRVILSEFQFVIFYVPGKNNVIVDALTRVNRLNTRDELVSVTDFIPRIFSLEGCILLELLNPIVRLTKRYQYFVKLTDTLFSVSFIILLLVILELPRLCKL
jgi:hypothetical protein